jgi:multiple sugar transport system permease protein
VNQHIEPGAGTRRPRILESERRVAKLLVAPAIGGFALVAAYPLLAVLWLSLRRRMPVFAIDRFVGLSNFLYMLHDSRFWNALANTAYFTAVSVALELVLGLALALGLRRAFPGRGLVRTALLVPWVVPTVVASKMWAWMLAPEVGLVNRLLGRPDIDWLGSPALAIHAAIAVDVWKTTPFVALLLGAALEMIPADLYRAARVDGAGPLRTFREVTLPLLGPAILVTLLFRTLDAFRVFDSIFVLTGGGPANTTETLSIYAYKVLFQTLQFGYGSALALATGGWVVRLSDAYLRLLARQGGALVS